MTKPREDFKWFGEGFDGFPKILPEDCVEYAIYIIDSKLNDLEKREKLREIQSAERKLTIELTKVFIWQREGIHLDLERDDTQSLLRGRTNYGDSVEDEWLVVFILRELSKKFPDAWVRVVDTDGQFLLIEAAAVLPRWVNPEVAEYRAWINNGDLLIIPPDETKVKGNNTGTIVNSLSLQESLRFLSIHRSKLLKLPKIQAEAFYRLGKYPEQILASLHHAIVRIPRKLAYILHDDPAYISSAIEAFYLRDPIALRPLRSHSPSELIFSPEDIVRVSTKFTKVGYAQVKSQQFDPPRSWAAALSFKDDPKSQTEAEMGMKLSCGFEMLVCDPQNQDKKAVREIKIILEDLQADTNLLPSDTGVRDWDMREDDEKWLDINFEDFDKELGSSGGAGTAGAEGGFGDKGAQENLRKMVARFEDFLNDDTAVSEGDGLFDDLDDEEDDDDDESSTLNSGSDPADKEGDVDFNEDRFTEMMREMMGMPSIPANSKPASEVKHSSRKTVKRSVSDRVERAMLGRDLQAMEEELQEAGALDLDPKQGFDVSKPLRKASDTRCSGSDPARITLAAEELEEEEDVDIDFDVANSLLAERGSQSGIPTSDRVINELT